MEERIMMQMLTSICCPFIFSNVLIQRSLMGQKCIDMCGIYQAPGSVWNGGENKWY
jgi:hypothetical protein